MMTVSKLIEQLQKMPQDQVVILEASCDSLCGRGELFQVVQGCVEFAQTDGTPCVILRDREASE